MKMLPRFVATWLGWSLALWTASAQVNITTWQVNNQHTGNNASETVLTPDLVRTPGNFKLLSYPQMDGQVYGQPLVMGSFSNGNDRVFCATQRAKLYAFDVTPAGVATPTSWSPVSLIPSSVSNYVPAPVTNVGSGDIDGTVGITSTPVIDPNSKTLYVVSKLLDPSGSPTAAGSYHQYLWALNLADGTVKLGPTEIKATFPGVAGDSTTDVSNGTVAFNPFHEHMRCAMSLDNGVLWLAYASHSDTTPYRGEIIGYDPTTFQQVKSFTTQNYNNQVKGGLWMGGASLAFDPLHNIYASVGNGDYNSAQGNWGESVIKINPANALASGQMFVDGTSPANWFTPVNWGPNVGSLNYNDADMGAGGCLLMPQENPSITNNKNLLVVGGKQGTLYVLDRDYLGGINNNDSGVLQQIAEPNGIFATAAYYNGTIYIAPAGDPLRAYQVNYDGTNYLKALTTSPNTAQVSETYGNKGATPFISSNGKTNGIVWVQAGSVVRAYDATNLSKGALVTFTLTASGTPACQVAKFGTITVANGKMYAAGIDSQQGGGTFQSYLFTFGPVPTAAGAPNQPTGVTGQTLSQSSTQVNWVDQSGGSASYTVSRSTSATTGFTVVSGNLNGGTGTLSYVDSGLLPNTTYYYEVTAFNNAGSALPTAPLAITTFPNYVEPNLTAYWPIEEAGASSTADATGNGHTGTLPGSEREISSSAGLINNGFHAHGTGQAPSRIVVSDTADLRFTSSQSFTLSAWVKPDVARSGEQTVIAKARDAGTGYYGIYLNGNGNFLGRGPNGDIVGTSVASPTVWVHVALVQDGFAATRTLYVNGKAEATGPAQDGTGMGDLWMLQQNITGNVESLAGNLDEVRLYNRALVAGEITNLIGPPILEVDSVLAHGSVGNLPLGIWPTTGRKVEPRSSGTYKLVLTAATPLQTGVSSNVGTATLDPSSNRRVIVTLSAANATTTNVTLSGLLAVGEPAGTASGTATIPFNVLKGDVNGDGVVNSQDYRIINNNHATITSAATSAFDLNLDGTVDASDDALATGANGTSLSGGQSATNLALYGLNPKASTVTGNNTAAMAFDLNTTGTRWDSVENSTADPSWIMVDLGTPCTIQQIILNWETAAGKMYTLDVANSADGTTPPDASIVPGTSGSPWVNFATETNNTTGANPGTNPHPPYVNNLGATYRYVRMYGQTRTSTYGYALWDFQVIGYNGNPPAPSAAPVVAPGSISTSAGTPISYQIQTKNSPASYALSGASFLSVSSTGLVTGTVPAVGTYQVTLSATNAVGTGTNTLSINAGAQSPSNLSLNQPASASSTNGGNTPAMAVDANTTGTRWESIQGTAADPSWIMVDLGTPCTVQQVTLAWENAAGNQYTIDLSNDKSNPGLAPGTAGSPWVNFATETNNTTGTGDGSVRVPYTNGTLTGTYQYVRVYGQTRTSPYGYSLWDFQVTGVRGAVSPTPAITSATSATATAGSAFSYQVTGSNNPTWYSASNLPSGLNINGTSGLISGAVANAGTYTPTISAANTSGAGTATLTLTVQAAASSGYASWQSQNFTSAEQSNPAISGPNAAPAGDGMTNLMKYALGLKPKVNGTSGLPVESVTISGGQKYLTLTYTKNMAATDVTCTGEVSSDMQTWSSGSAKVSTTVTNNADGKTQTVVMQDLTPMSGTAKRFIHLKVIQP